jgi:hypothetical protein
MTNPNIHTVFKSFGLIALLIACTFCANAREPIRLVATDAAGAEIFSVEQTYNGKRQKNPNTKPTRDPERFETDFYQITYKNLSNMPITVKRMALGVRYGTGTMVGVKSAATSSNDSWGAGLQERDLVAQPMFDKNVLAAGKSQTGEYFISTRDLNYIDRVIQIEHLGKTYELKWEMLFSKGE